MPTTDETLIELTAVLRATLGGFDGFLVLTAPPTAELGTIGSVALDIVGLAFYGPKDEDGWGSARWTGGANGWTPVLALESDGARRVLKIVDWTGGGGTKPAAPRYIGASGLVTTAAEAVDVRGPAGVAGTDGWTPVFTLEVDGERRVLRITDWTGGTGTKPATGYLSASGLSATAAGGVDLRGPAGASGTGTGDLLAANNLSDLASASAARGNLSVYSIAQVDAALAGKADDSDISALDARVDALEAAGGGGGGGDLAGVIDYTLHRMRQDMGTSVLETPYGYADPLQTGARLNLVASTGEYFATGHVQNQPTSGDGATPTVESTATLAVGTAATSHSLTGLTGAANGREVIVLVAQDGTGTCSATIGGQAMSELGTQSNTGVRLTALRRNLTGAETNLNITITTSGSTTIAAQAYCIAGMQGTPTVAFDTTFIDPPSLTSGFGATNTLWLAVTAHEADRNFFAPGSYTNALVTRANATGDFSGSLCSLASARRARNIATEDPGSFSLQGSFSGNSVSATIAIRPGPPAAEAMDLRWNAYDLPADPARLNMQFAVEVLGGTLTLGGTLRGWLGRDGGTTFAEATLTVRSVSGGVHVINGLGVDVSGQPAGDDAVARITTTTGVTLRVLDMAVLAGG